MSRNATLSENLARDRERGQKWTSPGRNGCVSTWKIHIISLSGRAAGLIDKQPKKEVLVAVKALKDESTKEQKNDFFREVSLMSILTHPNIVQLLAVSTEEEPYGMVFEFMSGGDLNQYLRNALPAETSPHNEETKKGITRNL